MYFPNYATHFELRLELGAYLQNSKVKFNLVWRKKYSTKVILSFSQRKAVVHKSAFVA